MMRCCKKCGALLEDEATVCDFCGAVLEIPKAEEPVPHTPAEVTPEEITLPAPRRKFYKKKWFILVCIVLAMVLAALTVIACVQISAPMQAVAYYEEILNGDCTHLVEVAPMEFWESISGRYGSTEECLADQARYIESIRKTSGISKSAKVVDRELLSTEDLTGITDKLQKRYGISPDRVTAAQQLIIKLDSQYQDRSTTSAGLLIAVKIDSKWYLWYESTDNFWIYGLTYVGIQDVYG